MLKNCFNKAILSDICPVQGWHTMQYMEKVTPFSSRTVTTITTIQLTCLMVRASGVKSFLKYMGLVLNFNTYQSTSVSLKNCKNGESWQQILYQVIIFVTYCDQTVPDNHSFDHFWPFIWLNLIYTVLIYLPLFWQPRALISVV